MHEEATLRDLRRTIDEIADRNGAARIVALSIRLGALSHFSVESFRTGWERVALGSAAEGARLHVRLSDDWADPAAQGVVLETVEVAAPAEPTATVGFKSERPVSAQGAASREGHTPCV